MGLLRTIAVAILGFSAFIFIVLFGRLPFFRKTPIGLLHRIIWIHFPNGVAYLDSRLFDGRFLGFWRRAGSYIFFENHPLVLIFFTSLLSIGEAIFIPSAWPRVSLLHKLFIPIVVGLPYYFLYASVVTKSFITPENHAEEMKRYPYDKVIFHPGHRCSTCEFLKPARSKHCSHCKGCISRQDHHCVWLTNCVGLNNYRYFLSLLLSLSIMLVYGSWLGYSLITKTLDALVPPTSPVRMRKQSWTTFLNMWAAVVAADPRIGGVSMLMVMTAPLAFAFFVYHTYLIWAGMTTNESAKWSDWKDDVADGVAFRLTETFKMSDSALLDPSAPTSSWPRSSTQMLVLTDGEPPKEGFRIYDRSNDIIQPDHPEARVDRRFVRVKSMKEIDNIYDLGFRNNLRHMADRLATEVKPKCTPAELMLKVILMGTLSHYETRGMIDDKRLDHMLSAGKQILYKTHQESDVRHGLGLSPDIWQGLTDVFTKAIPVLESQSFIWKSPPAANYEHSSSNLIAYNYFSLVKDIERLNDLCTIARNLLATTKKAQNMAAEKGFDQRVLALVDTCVRVTARGFDGETNARNEERWQKVVNLYKRLLITCLQFLHNFIMHNEQRKMVLWLDLFGYHSTGDSNIIQPKEPLDQASSLPEGLAPVVKTGERIVNPPIRALYDQTAEDLLLETISNFPREPATIKEEAAMLLLANIKDHMEKLLGRDLTAIQEMGKDPDQVKEIRAALTAILGAKVDGWSDLQDRAKDLPPALPDDEPPRKKAILTIDRSATAGFPRICWSDLPDLNEYGALAAGAAPIAEEDTSMPRSAQSAAETLQEAKDELMARLQEASHMGDERDHDYDTGDAGTVGDDDSRSLEAVADGSMDEEEEDDDEDDDDYRGRPGDQQRGLLTDIPLVLGPAEIEALPMIIQAGIVDSFGLKGGERTGTRNMQALRCHVLLTQETGRNLLRELLIFIAAWDLPDDELYFKMMVQIMDAVLKNGLMSHAYSDFGQPKDIISPAQAVVVKILTHIFRAKYSPASVTGSNQANATKNPAPLSRVDVLTVRYIFTIFRGNIIPETCALIYLQGQIRAGRALPEDFPLNLWDMERVYEGVYQFLEFFAVLTENNDWKNLLVKWEIVYDLVTLIKELEASIPKGQLSQLNLGRPNSPSRDPQQGSSPGPIAVERPYDPSDPDPTDGGTASRPESPPITEDPSEFEWRNLKKLVVLVLSSLVWKCPEVQDQIRKHGGVETILSCTNFDAHNPYIKEHAVMCLKFLLEGNRENQRLIEELEAREVRDDGGMLEQRGLEAVIDKTGKLALRPRDEQLPVAEEID
ncbi:essential cytoplasmic protein Ctr86 [Aspergillus karnatakaensis]|uniref:essential cytoplasmic protein Ctr86 n=1 Tax=Aspergillus karnatakaensis TaxID=1810916 RepID=UPI003CCCB1C6